MWKTYYYLIFLIVYLFVAHKFGFESRHGAWFTALALTCGFAIGDTIIFFIKNKFNY